MEAIPAGTELLMAYCRLADPFPVRQRRLLADFGFACRRAALNECRRRPVPWRERTHGRPGRRACRGGVATKPRLSRPTH